MLSSIIVTHDVEAQHFCTDMYNNLTSVMKLVVVCCSIEAARTPEVPSIPLLPVHSEAESWAERLERFEHCPV